MQSKFGLRVYAVAKLCCGANIYHFNGLSRLMHIQPKFVETKLEAPEIQSISFPERRIRILTCGNLYAKWRKERRYWHVHKGDHDFDVPYIDTGCGVVGRDSTESPVVVALHGAPGSYEIFSPITSHLYLQGARIIAPCFPDLTTKDFRDFRHSSQEKSEYVKDFLKELNVPKVDLLMCHSSALFSGLLLCLENQYPEIGSLCLLNSTTFDYPRGMQPFLLIALVARLFEFPIGRDISLRMSKSLVKSRTQVKGVNILDHLLSVFTLVFSDVPQGAHHFQELLERNLPVLFAYSEKDKLIHKTSSLKMARMMVDESEIHKYDSQGRLTTPGGDNPFRKVMAFEKGSHFLTKKHPEEISEALTDFLFQHFDRHRRS